MKASRSRSGISKAASRSGAGHPPVRSRETQGLRAGQAGDPHPLEETGQLAHLEAQRIRAHLDQLPGRPQPGHAQRRVGAGGHDQLDPGRAVAQERLHLGVHVGVLGEVVVVEDDHHVPVACGQLVEQDRQHRVGDPVRTGAQRRQRPGADGGIRARQRGDDMAPQPDGFGVAAVQTSPRRRNVPSPWSPIRSAMWSCRIRPARTPVSGHGRGPRAAGRAAADGSPTPRGNRCGASLVAMTPTSTRSEARPAPGGPPSADTRPQPDERCGGGLRSRVTRGACFPSLTACGGR